MYFNGSNIHKLYIVERKVHQPTPPGIANPPGKDNRGWPGAVGGRPEREKYGFAYTKPYFGARQRIYRIYRNLPDLAEVVSATAARSLPSTRAGGQDDGSFLK